MKRRRCDPAAAIGRDLVERCTTCQFYDRHNARGGDNKTANAGQCRRSAPALSPINQKSYMIEGVWPTVRDDDWCGEWKALVRRVDPTRISDVLNAPLSSPLPSPRSGPSMPRAAMAAFGAEPSTLTSLPLPPRMR
jgi:hypothetical protein